MSTITSPYETLIRHNPDGSIGAHHQKIKRYYDDETEPPELINEKIQPPVQLNVAGGEVTAIVGQAFVQATAQIAAQTAQIAGLSAALQASEATATQQAATIESQAAQIVALQAQVAALTPPPDEPGAQAPAEDEPLV
jgi:hypothetical protein